eukprot:7509323-Prorocentrum_lima.AAC.1
MTSSLVGSEMCIRDSASPVVSEPPVVHPDDVSLTTIPLEVVLPVPDPVSYTHLTLPTICSV